MTFIEQPWKCNACEARRDRDANNWWLVIPIYRHGEIIAVGVQLLPWDDGMARAVPGAAHCCGLTCALKVIGQQADVIRLGQQRKHI